MTIEVALPTLHIDQVRAYKQKQDLRPDWVDIKPKYKVIRCGRRWGKSVLGETWLCDGAVKGYPVGWFAPNYKYVAEVYNEIVTILEPVKASSSKTAGVIRTLTGGRVDFWTLEDDRAGRSRKYRRVFIDEAAFTNSNMMDIWKKSIRPTLLDYGGDCIVASNTNGVDEDNFLWQICHQPEHGFQEFHAPSFNNPLIPERHREEPEADYLLRRQVEFEELRKSEHPLVFRQEYEAEFVDWSGVAFFPMDALLVQDKPLPMPRHLDAVFAVMDTATKTGTENDGSAVTFFGYSQHAEFPVQILDWDYQQIEGSTLHTWLPTIIEIGEDLARRCKARNGFLGIWIEDKASGEILLQQGKNRDLAVHTIESRLTALGKDERALSVSGYVYTGKVKLTCEAYDKVVVYKKVSRNHLVSQVTGFRIGDKDAARRADDLLDTFTYGIALALGNEGGF